MKQTTTTLNGHTILLFEVDEGITNIRLSRPFNAQWHVSYDYIPGHQYSSGGFCIWYKMWGGKKKQSDRPTLLGLASDIPEEIAAGYVAKVYDSPRLYADYQKPQGVTHMQASSAVESLHSFVKSHHYNPSTTVILIKE